GQEGAGAELERLRVALTQTQGHLATLIREREIQAKEKAQLSAQLLEVSALMEVARPLTDTARTPDAKPLDPGTRDGGASRGRGVATRDRSSTTRDGGAITRDGGAAAALDAGTHDGSGVATPRDGSGLATRDAGTLGRGAATRESGAITRDGGAAAAQGPAGGAISRGGGGAPRESGAAGGDKRKRSPPRAAPSAAERAESLYSQPSTERVESLYSQPSRAAGRGEQQAMPGPPQDWLIQGNLFFFLV
ncbi:hypothetical protein T484DRAFT_1804175, partial [Baffinella frigidus]